MYYKFIFIILAIFIAGCAGGPKALPAPEVIATRPPSPNQSPTPAWTNTPAPTATSRPTSTPVDTTTPSSSPTPALTLFDKFNLFPWVAYSPTNYIAGQTSPTVEGIVADLKVLYDAGFRGLVTYSAGDIFAEIPRLAHEAGFEGVAMGIWSPGDPAETQGALNALPYVDGYVVGNEGLTFDRYDYTQLEAAIADLRKNTSKPVTTTEVYNLYFKDERLINLGDWLFPNTHPFWQNITDPVQAVQWTQSTFEAMSERAAGLAVVFKEVGLPTEGAPRLSEYQQAEYYARLRESPVKFVYFEAFDQPWKTEGTVGAHWGLFNADRSPKVASRYVVNGFPPLYVYADANSPYNHFVPEGFMGCTRGIKVNPNDTSSAYAGKTALKITYTPCSPGWAGIYWWDPPGSNWCDKPGGIDLTGWTKLTFWAKGAVGGEPVEFKVGGLRKANGDSCDSMEVAQTTYPLTLEKEWTQYTIPLVGQPLDHVVGGFVWVTDTDKPITLYLDEIKFEWSER